MIKGLSRLKFLCQDLCLFYQAAICCRSITMSGSPEKPPPIGAFVINPLPVSTEKQTNKSAVRENNGIGSVSDKSTVSENKEVTVVSDGGNKGKRPLKISRDDESCEENSDINGGKGIQNSASDESLEGGVTPSVAGSLTSNVKKSQVAELSISSTDSVGSSDKNSTKMMKLGISGPPKYKFDQKKTVLPHSLLQGVTEFVKKQQVSLDSSSALDSSNQDKSVCSEKSLSVDNKPKVFGMNESNVNKSTLKSEMGIKQDEDGIARNVVYGSMDAHNLQRSIKVLTGENADLNKCLPENHDSVQVPHSNSADVKCSVHNLSVGELESSKDVQKFEPVNLSQGEVEMSFRSEAELETSTCISNINVSALGEKSELDLLACTNGTKELNDLEHSLEASGSVPLVHLTKPDELNSSTSPDIRSGSRAPSENKVQNETETVSAESTVKNSSTDSLEESGVECEVNPFSEMDIDDLLDVSTSPEGHKETDDTDFKMFAKELLHIDASILGKNSAKPKDIVYNLSDLFSGELEQRRKRELKKQKRKAKKWERYSKKKKKSASTDTADETVNGQKEEKPKKPVPNYFVAIQITDQGIKTGLKAVQDKVISENKKLQPALNKLATLHLTMMVLSLRTEEDMEKSRQALNKASEKLLSQYSDMLLQLDVSGLGHFRNNVVFAKVKHDHQVSTLNNVADIVEESFCEQEIISPDQRGFKPHMTIMKLSSIKGLKKKGLKKIDEKLYSDFVDSDFGSENISTLQLCAMMKPKDKSGYYQVEHKVQFAKSGPPIPGPTSIGESTEQHGEISDKSELTVSVNSPAKNFEDHIVEKDEIDSKLDIMAEPGDDILIAEAFNKTSESAGFVEKVTVEISIKKETGNDTSLSMDSARDVDNNKHTEIQVNIKQIDDTEDVVGKEEVFEKEDHLPAESADVIETEDNAKDSGIEMTTTEHYLFKPNSDISEGTTVKDIKLEVEGLSEKQLCPDTVVSNQVNQPGVTEMDRTDEESQSAESSLEIFIENINVDDSALDLSVGTPNLREIPEEVSTVNDSAIDISLETGSPKLRGIPENFPTRSDRAVETNVDIENTKLSETDISVGGDSFLGNSIHSEKADKAGVYMESPINDDSPTDNIADT